MHELAIGDPLFVRELLNHNIRDVRDVMKCSKLLRLILQALVVLDDVFAILDALKSDRPVVIPVRVGENGIFKQIRSPKIGRLTLLPVRQSFDLGLP